MDRGIGGGDGSDLVEGTDEMGVTLPPQYGQEAASREIWLPQ